MGVLQMLLSEVHGRHMYYKILAVSHYIPSAVSPPLLTAYYSDRVCYLGVVEISLLNILTV